MALRVIFSRAVAFVRELFQSKVSPQTHSPGNEDYRPTTPLSFLLR